MTGFQIAVTANQSSTKISHISAAQVESKAIKSSQLSIIYRKIGNPCHEFSMILSATLIFFYIFIWLFCEFRQFDDDGTCYDYRDGNRKVYLFLELFLLGLFCERIGMGKIK